MLKKALAYGLVAAFAFSLVGCGEKAPPTPATPPEKTEPATPAAPAPAAPTPPAETPK